MTAILLILIASTFCLLAEKQNSFDSDFIETESEDNNTISIDNISPSQGFELYSGKVIELIDISEYLNSSQNYKVFTFFEITKNYKKSLDSYHKKFHINSYSNKEVNSNITLSLSPNQFDETVVITNSSKPNWDKSQLLCTQHNFISYNSNWLACKN